KSQFRKRFCHRKQGMQPLSESKFPIYPIDSAAKPWQAGHPALINTQMSDYDTRFSGIRRLYSVAGLERLRKSHVCVIGIGGVGSWVVEALARTGLGQLTLIDMDEVCVSNVNRQL